MNDWQVQLLGDLSRFSAGSAFPKELQGNLAGEIPFIKVSDMSLPGNERRITRANNWISAEVARQRRARPFPAGSSVFAKIGEALKSERIRVLSRPTAIDNNMMAATATELADPSFLSYLLREIGLTSLAHGSALPYLRQRDLEKVPVLVPGLPEQRRIAGVLGAFDDLIDTNTQLAEALVDLGQAAFRARVISVDGTEPFAVQFEILSGGTPKTSRADYWNGHIPWFSVVDTPPEALAWVSRTAKHVTELGVAESATKVLPVETVILSARGTVGQTALTAVPMAMNQSCYGIRARSSERGFFTLFTVRSLVEALQAQAHGSVFDTITRATLNGMVVPALQPEEIAEFDEEVAPFMDMARELNDEAHQLTEARDELLPLLMSGRVTVDEAWEAVP